MLWGGGRGNGLCKVTVVTVTGNLKNTERSTIARNKEPEEGRSAGARPCSAQLAR